MSDALDLIRAVLGEDCTDDDFASQVLDEALEREIDPMLHCFAAFGIDQTLAMERAARWAGFAFCDTVPCRPGGRVEPTRLEALAGVRVFRMLVLDREVAFAAPDFFGLLRLKRKLGAAPQLRHQVCLLPTAVLRDYLAQAASEALIVAARQGLARRWPYASAQLELTAPARYGFVAGLTILVVMVLLAPFAAEAWLLPAVICLLVGPAVIRLAATATPLPLEPVLLRPPDEELPLYSILIPLRSEAAMVPQLFEAMWALDYPALCIKRTNKRIAIGGHCHHNQETEPMDVARVRFMAEQALGVFETLDREDATYHAMLGLSDILLYVADDPVAVNLVRRIEALIDRECGGPKPDVSKFGNSEHAPLIAL